jgi:hypothetical protein
MSTHRNDLGPIDAENIEPKITTAEKGVRRLVSPDTV